MATPVARDNRRCRLDNHNKSLDDTDGKYSATDGKDDNRKSPAANMFDAKQNNDDNDNCATDYYDYDKAMNNAGDKKYSQSRPNTHPSYDSYDRNSDTRRLDNFNQSLTIKQNIPDNNLNIDQNELNSVHDHSLASFWIDVKFWFFFLAETIVRLLWRLICALGRQVKEYFKQSFMSSYLGRALMKIRELIFNNSLQRQRLLDWLREILPPDLVPRNFTTDWSSGVLLCSLCESILPGSCPRYELLAALPPHSVIILALNLVESCFEFRTRVTPQELLEDSKNSERKWIQLLSQIRLSHSTQVLRLVHHNRKESLRTAFAKQQFFTSAAQFFNDCFIRGTGIVHGVRSRRCCFAIYHGEQLPGPETTLVLHIEVRGPNSSYGLLMMEIKPEVSSEDEMDVNNNIFISDSLRDIIRKRTNNNVNYQTLLMKAIRESPSGKYSHIPIFYSVHHGHVRVQYIPTCTGKHRLNIIWKGQYVLGSPFRPNVQSSSYVEHKRPEVDPKMEPGNRYPVILLPEGRNNDLDQYATVIERKVLQKRIFHGGKSYDFDDYFDRTFKRLNQNIEIDRRIIEANTKNSDSPDDSMPQTPIYSKNILGTLPGNDENIPEPEEYEPENDDDEEENMKNLENILEDIDIELLTDSSGSWRVEGVGREDREDSPHSKSSTFSSVSSKSLKEMMKNNGTKLKSDLEKLKNTLKAIGTKKKKDKKDKKEKGDK